MSILLASVPSCTLSCELWIPKALVGSLQLVPLTEVGVQEEEKPPLETMSRKDVLKFPIMGRLASPLVRMTGFWVWGLGGWGVGGLRPCLFNFSAVRAAHALVNFQTMDSKP